MIVMLVEEQVTRGRRKIYIALSGEKRDSLWSWFRIIETSNVDGNGSCNDLFAALALVGLLVLSAITRQTVNHLDFIKLYYIQRSRC